MEAPPGGWVEPDVAAGAGIVVADAWHPAIEKTNITLIIRQNILVCFINAPLSSPAIRRSPGKNVHLYSRNLVDPAAVPGSEVSAWIIFAPYSNYNER